MPRLLSLNIRHGGGQRILRILEWLEKQNPDFIVLPEWRSSNDLLLSRSFETQGFNVARFSRNGIRDNGVLIAAKENIEAKRVTPPTADKGELGLAQCPSVSICAAYFPLGEHKRPFFQQLFDLSKRYRKTPFLIVGDINTGNNQMDLSKGATRFACADMFDALMNTYGMIDIWRREHGADAQEWTWHSVKNGFRIDHAISNQAFLDQFQNIQCRYDQEPREAGLTDHSALVMDFS